MNPAWAMGNSCPKRHVRWRTPVACGPGASSSGDETPPKMLVVRKEVSNSTGKAALDAGNAGGAVYDVGGCAYSRASGVRVLRTPVARWGRVRPHASSGEVGTASKILGRREEGTKAEKATRTVAVAAEDEGGGSSGGGKHGSGRCQGVGGVSRSKCSRCTTVASGCVRRTEASTRRIIEEAVRILLRRRGGAGVVQTDVIAGADVDDTGTCAEANASRRQQAIICLGIDTKDA
ncbi:hypothetical protein DFH08DRAFT_810242 [Mycena albidolilacea]|uniref:Uncharacterized protein n=1 Tax=Mycena albidolilacea TaxID=1033008 RepID=A0AAD6ZZ78_9AGAR|nr:hypothetical protein DFH08DRAFT_810242 [Mycena albidolilacea]